MTKSELIEQVSELLKLPNGKAEQIVNCIFDSMVKALQEGEGIEIRGFGSFTVREYKSYDGRNPRTGDTVHVSPKRLPFFKVGKDLRERVNIPAAAHAAKMQRMAAESAAAAAASHDRLVDPGRPGGQSGNSATGARMAGALAAASGSGGYSPPPVASGSGGFSPPPVAASRAPEAPSESVVSSGHVSDEPSGSAGENGSAHGEHGDSSSTSALSGSAGERPSEAAAPGSDSSSSWK